MAKGIIDRQGTVTVSWGQDEVLLAPDGAHGVRMKYFPCESCGEVKPVSMNVVSFLCDPCTEIRDRITGQCEECGCDVTDNKVYCDNCRREFIPDSIRKGIDRG